MNNSSDSGNIHVGDTFPESVTIVLVSITTVLATVTSLWNCVLIIIIIRTPILHTLTNAIIVSVAVSDLTTGLFKMPLTAATWYYGTKPFSSEMCSFVGLVTSVCDASISYGILAVSLDRCAAMSRPLQYNHFINTRSISVMLSVVWSLSLVASLFPIFGWGLYSFSNNHKVCTSDLTLFRSYSLVMLIVCHILPAGCIVTALIVIVNEARSHHRVITIAQLAIAMYSGPAAAAGVNYSRSTFRAMRTFLIIIIIYLTMFLPLQLYRLSVAAHSTSESKIAFIFLTMFSFISCLATPITISSLNGKFKLSIQLMFKRQNRVRPGGTESEAFTISTGLQSVLEASMKFIPGGHLSRDQTAIPGTSGQTVSRYSQRKISVLPEVNTSSSGTPSSDKVITIRKSASFPT